MKPPVAVVERGIAPEALPGAVACAERITLDLDKIGALRLGPSLEGTPVAVVLRRATDHEVRRIVSALAARGVADAPVHRLEPSEVPAPDARSGRSA